MREKGHSKNISKKLFTNKKYPHHCAVFYLLTAIQQILFIIYRYTLTMEC